MHLARRTCALLLVLLVGGGYRSVTAQELDSTRHVTPSPPILPNASPFSRAGPPEARHSSIEASLKEPIRFTALDSLIVNVNDVGGDEGTLFGQAQVTYTDAVLQAYQIDILFNLNELRASGMASDSGLVGRPQIQQAGEVFSGTQLAFNMGTRRGRIVGGQSQISEGFIHAGIAKISEDSTIYIKDGAYTTCSDVDDPSYSLRSSKMKIVDKKWIYTGPLQLFIYHVPTPLWLPFGFLPAQSGRRSGPLPPQYGEDEFGFYLRDWGWYFALNDYMDLQLKGGLWTKGSWSFSTLYRYNKRYLYTGQLQFNYSRFRQGERGDPDFGIRSTGAFRWTHNQTINPTSSLSANVNLTSSSFLRAVSQQYNDRVRQTVQSSIRYSKRWPSGGRNMNINLSQQQVFATGEVNLTIPNFSFNQSTRKPFERDARGPGEKERWYEKITYSYNMSLNNNFNFRPLSDSTGISWYEALFSPSKFRKATGRDEQFSFKTTHTVPISAAFSLNRLPLLGAFRLNLSPFINYEEDWFIRTTRQFFSDSLNTLQQTTVPGFFALRQFSLGVSSNTTFYGIFPIKVGPYSGLRHTVRPSLSFNYQPDFFKPSWGYTRTYKDLEGVDQRYAVVTGVRRGLQESLSFALNNTFETKRVQFDSTGQDRTRITKLFNLDFATAYNFAADSLKLGSISMRGRTRILGKLDLDFSSIYSPYNLSSDGRLRNDFIFNLTKLRFARLTNLNFTARTSLKSKRRGVESRPATTPRAAFDPTRLDQNNPFFQQPGNAVSNADFAIPWSLGLDFTYGVSRNGFATTRRAILNMSTDFNLTPNWKVQARSGFDFERNELVTTNLSLLRDFCCWQMSFNWVPFGDFQSWGFDLHVKSSQLGDLLRIRQPKSDVKGRFGSLL